MFNKRCGAFVVALTAVGAGAQTVELDPAGERATAAQRVLEEVMVYGTKRSAAQAVQEVAGQVAAFSENVLEVRQVVTLEDLSFATANVSMDDAGTAPGVANFSIRGLGINSSIPSIDPSVGVFVDGVYLGVTYGAVVDTFDLESVEIYKGPQGVLFGRNVTGGAVMLRTRRPSHDFQLRTSAAFETESEVRLAGSVEGSLVEGVLAGKVSAFWKNDKGHFNNRVLGKDVGAEETFVVRPAVTWTPTDTFDVTAIIEYGVTDGDGTRTIDAQGTQPGNPTNNIRITSDFTGVLDVEWYQITLESSWDIGPGTITGIVGWRDLDHFAQGDGDGTPLDLFHIGLETDQNQFSVEARYNAQISPVVDITAGVYYFEQEFSYVEQRRLFGGALQLAGGGDQDHDTWGLFVSTDIHLADDVTANLGLRYTEETKDVEIFGLGSCVYGNLTPAAVCVPGTGRTTKESWGNWTPKIGLQWQAHESAMVYGHWSRGVRSGGFNFRTPVADPVATDEETHDSIEVGVKSQWADGRITANGAIFFSRLQDLQRETIIVDPALGNVQDIRNVADAEIRGFDVDLSALITDAFAVSLSAGWLSSKYTEVTADLNLDGVIDAGDRDLDLPRLAPWTFAVGATYDVSLGNVGWLSARADYAFRDRAFFDDANRSRFNAYDILDLSLSLSPNDERWTVRLYGKNLLDEAVLGVIAPLPFGAFGGGDFFAPVKKGRRFGLEVAFEI